MIKKCRYIIEYVALRLLVGFFAVLPWKTASHLGGFFARHIAPHLAVSRKAKRQIQACFPAMTQEEVRQCERGMWDNLGRVVAEYPHLKKIGQEHNFSGNIKAYEAMRDDGKGGILLSAHMGNWEIGPAITKDKIGLTLDVVYRRPNNPYVAKMLEDYRYRSAGSCAYEKSKAGMIAVVKALREGAHIAMLIDQKYNEGVETLFFGRTVRTSTAFYDLAVKYDIPLLPAFVIRQNGSSFKTYIDDPIHVKDQTGALKPVEAVIDEYHARLEYWITKHPENWLWLHRRWREEIE
jgi:KDO2-lipid IV(A) lauroyltransferase